MTRPPALLLLEGTALVTYQRSSTRRREGEGMPHLRWHFPAELTTLAESLITVFALTREAGNTTPPRYFVGRG